MVQADADIMLIDEVLAVGDAAFAQKCMDVFHERRRAGKTIVLVTHDMATVQSLCHRAMLLARRRAALHRRARGRRAALLPRCNFAGASQRPAARRAGAKVVDVNARVVDARLRDARAADERSRRASRSRSTSLLEAAPASSTRPSFVFHVRNADGQVGLRAHARRSASASRPGRRRAARGRGREPARAGPLLARRATCARSARRAAWRCRACGCCTFVVDGRRRGPAWSRVRADVEAVLERERP